MPIELLNLRQENNKTYDLGNGQKQLVASIGAIHYKNDYASLTEPWKDIDLTWVDNKITKAPYELTRDGQKITIRNKKDGEVSTIELISVFPPGMAFEIVPELTRVSFRHVLPTDKIPFEAKFKVTGKGIIRTRAFDDLGELEIETTQVGDVLTEKIAGVVDKQTHKARPAKGSIRVDPTWQVGASTDDCYRGGAIGWNLTSVVVRVGFYRDFEGAGVRFTNITIPHGASITTTKLTLQCRVGYSNPLFTRISAEDVDDAPTFADDYVAFDARFATHTTARIDWDFSTAWTANNNYDSIEFPTVIQEITDRAGWVSGNDIVIFWEDFDHRNDGTDDHCRDAKSYDADAANAPKLVITYVAPITGTVTLSGAGVISATVRAINQTTGTVYTGTTIADGTYFVIAPAGTYHICVEYTTGGVKYNAKSLWDVVVS